MRKHYGALVLLAALGVQPAYGQATGACCSNVDGQCEIATLDDCLNVINGIYQGDDTLCENVTCPPPTGACCLSGDCLDGMTEADCLASNGDFHGGASSCTPGLCPPPTGACCDGLFGGCHQVTQADCTNTVPLGFWLGAGTTCEEADCGEAGSCCDPSTGTCLFRAENWCVLVGRNFIGEGIPCEPNQCPQPPRGACCQQDGTCQPDMSESDCVNQTSGGVWAGADTTCDPVNPCPQPEVGACCFGTGGCLVTEDWLCADAFGIFHGDGSTCWPVPCESNPITGWCDNLDSYTDGTLMFNVGGWTGWDDSAAAAGTISTAQAHSAPNSIAVSNVDAVHPFTTAYSGGTWEIVAWQYVPSDLSGTTYFVVNSYYEHGGPYFFPVEIHMDGDNDVVFDALRDPNHESTLPLIYDQWVEIRIEADFENDWPGHPQSAGTINQYYNGQLLMTGSWIPITGGFSVGQLAIMNIDLFAPHPQTVYYDDLCIEKVSSSTLNPTRPLFVGTSDTTVDVTRTSDLSDAPDITWNDSTHGVRIEGAAGRPDGNLYLTGTGESAFRPNLYLSAFEGPAVPLCEFGTSFTAGPSGLGYGRGKLYGFFNFLSPLGIYEIDPDTCTPTLLVATGSRRFFALDYNPVDGLLYGYDTFGSPSGLCSINPDTLEITWVAPSIPASNSSGNALAVGNNTAYLAATRGAEGVPMYAYDLSQGPGGTWVAMTQPFPETNAQGGAAFARGPFPGDMNCDGLVDGRDIQGFQMAVIDGASYQSAFLDCTILNADTNLDGEIGLLDVASFVSLLLDE